MAVATGVIGALAAVTSAGASIYNSSQQADKPKVPKAPPEVKAPDTNSLVSQQARQRVAALGRQSTIRTSPLGIVGTGGPVAGSGASATLGAG